MVFPVIIEEFSFIGTIEYDALLVSLQDEWQQLDALLTSLGVDTAAELAEINETLQGFASMEAISSVLSSVVGGLGQFIIGLFSITFISFFCSENKIWPTVLSILSPRKSTTIKWIQ